MNENLMKNAKGQNVVDNGVSRSGMSLGYRSLGNGCLGHMIPITHQFILPGDHFSGSNHGQITYDQLAVPVVTPVQQQQTNYFVRLRSIYGNDAWQRFYTPRTGNGFSTGTLPSRDLADYIRCISTIYNYAVLPDQRTPATLRTVLRQGLGLYISSAQCRKLYCSQFLSQVSESLGAAPADTPSLMRSALAPFIGTGSLFDLFGYPLIPEAAFSDFVTNNIWENATSIADLFNRLISALGSQLNSDKFNDAYLRANYAVWSDYIRNRGVEPFNDVLVDFRDFGMSNVSTPMVIRLLCMHLVPWDGDMYVNGSVDDVCRHVYAPVSSSSSDRDLLRFRSLQPAEANFGSDDVVDNRSFVHTIPLTYYDQFAQSSVDVNLVLPAMVSTSSQIGLLGENPYGIDLRSLKWAKMAENVLQRMFYYGDEYPERIAGLWGTKISDYSLIRPVYLSGSLSQSSVGQEVANVGTDNTTVGERTATMQGEVGSDGFDDYSDDFGIYIGYLSIFPQAQYDPTIMHHFITRYEHLPLPQFSQMADEISVCAEMSRSLRPGDNKPFAHHDYAHLYRSRVGEVHGRYRNDYSDRTFARFFIDSLAFNSEFVQCRPKLDMFVDSIALDGQFYYMMDHEFFVERALAMPTVIL